MASGQPAKLTITAYSDPNFTTKVTSVANPFTAWINPSSYSYNKTIGYNDRQAQGSPGPSPEFNRITGEEVSFSLVFDATGVIPVPPGQSYANGVSGIVQQFLTLATTVNGNIHSPNYLILGWAQLQFNCVLSSVKIDYTLFMPDGTPLRAKASVSFKSYTSETKLVQETKPASPDMTHMVTVLAGDTLPDLCYRIYGDSGYYMGIAKLNGLIGFRDVPPGTRLFFPPLNGGPT